MSEPLKIGLLTGPLAADAEMLALLDLCGALRRRGHTNNDYDNAPR